MSRPFFRTSIEELERAFRQKSSDPEFLKQLIEELSHRSTPRAEKLKVLATNMLKGRQLPLDHEIVHEQPDREPKPQATAPATTPKGPKEVAILSTSESNATAPTPTIPFPPLTNGPVEILAAWTALEVLSPPSFRRPEDLASDRYAVARFEGTRLPWEGIGERSRRNSRLYYQIVLGTIDIEKAVSKLLSAYADTRVERPASRGKAILAVVLVDREGRPIDEPAVAVSSFGWAVPRALAGQLDALGEWRTAEKTLVEGLDKKVRKLNANAEPLPLDVQTIHAAFQWLVTAVGLGSDLLHPPQFAIRTYEYYKNPEPPEPLLLNSFFLNDLSLATEHCKKDTAAENLRRYLGVLSPSKRLDLFADKAALEKAVAPVMYPPARWPNRGRQPLVLLQQAAVNLAANELKESGILAVNGPPGTGKTTLLRDIVAAVVTARARALANFDEPASAFTSSGQKLKAGNSWIHLYRVSKKIRGFEMVVASSNNKAVENISAELPGIGAIAADADGLRYFKTLSDELRGNETWGAIAAVLGNAANRAHFKQVFWWHEDVGLSTYLAAASGIPQAFEEVDPQTGGSTSRQPRVVANEHAPTDADEALRRWRNARTKFRQALKQSEDTLAELEKVRELSLGIDALAENHEHAQAKLDDARKALENLAVALSQAKQRLAALSSQLDQRTNDLAAHERIRPSFVSRLFRTQAFRTWREGYQQTKTASHDAKTAVDDALASVGKLETQVSELTTLREEAQAQANATRNDFETAKQTIEAARRKLGDKFVDQNFFAREHSERHKISPWLDEKTQRARDDVFIAAIAMHKAFVDAAARPLRHNLAALMSAFSGRAFTGEKETLLLDLWASLFLVVPLISTTFASVERMLGKLPPESLGWCLIDEAGQAVPQAAVGALMRTKRAVVVGDPLQIEPVVVLPDTLTETICRRFGVDPDRFNAPTASVQTLADSATPYFAEFSSRRGSRYVGVPLLVHRRCIEPMFGISNSIAYERLMVNATVSSGSSIKDALGPSQWLSVHGSAVEKWCPEEGQKLIELLTKLTHIGARPDLYIVTPFVVVQDRLRQLLRGSGLLASWTEDPWRWTAERVGTLHVVQGREAEAVILVLGAPAPQQTGARAWAGGRPNLLNVAVTRAKEVLYVIGNRDLWRDAGVFRELDARLPR